MSNKFYDFPQLKPIEPLYKPIQPLIKPIEPLLPIKPIKPVSYCTVDPFPKTNYNTGSFRPDPLGGSIGNQIIQFTNPPISPMITFRMGPLK